MFILRRITSEGKQSNEILGRSYNEVYPHTDQENPENFKQLIEPWPNQEEIFGFIVYDNGSSVLPLYKKSDYYVMCSDGKTFDRIKWNPKNY